MKLLELKLELVKRLDDAIEIITEHTKENIYLYGDIRLYGLVVLTNLRKDKITPEEIQRTIELVSQIETCASIMSK